MLNSIRKWLAHKQTSEHFRLIEDVYCMAVALGEHFKMMRAFQEMAPNLLSAPKMSAAEASALCEEMRDCSKNLYNSLHSGRPLTNEDVKNLSRTCKEFYTTIRDIDDGLLRGSAAMGGGSATIISPMTRYKSLKNQKMIANEF